MTESWCVVIIDGQRIKSNIIHKRGGRFEIVEAEDERHVSKVVDASEVITC